MPDQLTHMADSMDSRKTTKAIQSTINEHFHAISKTIKIVQDNWSSFNFKCQQNILRKLKKQNRNT